MGKILKGSSVNISGELWKLLFSYHVMNYKDAETEEKIKALMNDKVQKMINRDVYSKYKTASSDREREEARQQYLDNKGIPEDFRW